MKLDAAAAMTAFQATVLAVTLVGERLTGTGIAGVVALVAGVLVAAWSKRLRRPAT